MNGVTAIEVEATQYTRTQSRNTQPQSHMHITYRPHTKPQRNREEEGAGREKKEEGKKKERKDEKE